MSVNTKCIYLPWIFLLNFRHLHVSVLKQKLEVLDFPDGTVDRNRLPIQGQGFSPWSGKVPHAVEQQSLCTTTTEACVL